MIGREGTPYRKLRDVPELKNFFGAHPAAPQGPRRRAAAPQRAASRRPCSALADRASARAYHDPAFPPPFDASCPRPPGHRVAGAPPAPSEEKAATMTEGTRGPPRLRCPRSPAERPPRSNEATGKPAAVRPSPRPPAHAEMPTLLGTPRELAGWSRPRGALAPRGGTPAWAPAARSPLPSPLPEARSAGAASLPGFELPTQPPERRRRRRWAAPGIGAAAEQPAGARILGASRARRRPRASRPTAPVRLYCPRTTRRLRARCTLHHVVVGRAPRAGRCGALDRRARPQHVRRRRRGVGADGRARADSHAARAAAPVPPAPPPPGEPTQAESPAASGSRPPEKPSAADEVGKKTTATEKARARSRPTSPRVGRACRAARRPRASTRAAEEQKTTASS